MTATTPHNRAILCRDAESLEIHVPGGAALCDPAAPVVETSMDMSWAEYCGSLRRPAFLLPDSGFADLE